MRLALIIAVLFFAAMKSAVAQECVPPQLLAAQAIQAVPDAKIRAILHGDEARHIVTQYNLVPPVSHIEAESVVVLEGPSRPFVYIIGFTGNCTVFADVIPAEVFNSWAGRGA
jgi:hypothetical protein